MTVIFWLNDLPLWQAGLVLAGGAFLISIVGTAISRMLIPEQQLDLNNVLGGFTYMFLSQVYAGFIGFLLFGVYERFDDVRITMVTEVAAMASLDRVAQVFPDRTRDQIQASLRSYAQDVAKVDWPKMQSRSGEIAANPALDDLEYIFLAVETTSKKQREVLQFARDLLTEVRENRATRMMRGYGSLPILLWVVSIGGTLVAIGLPWLFGTPNVNADMAMTTLVIVMMVSILLVILKLSYPFGGSAALLPEPYLSYAVRPSGG